jgi:hypothetical protein
MKQTEAFEILLKNNVLDSNEFESNIDYLEMLKEFNSYRKMYGQPPLK